MTEDIFKMRYLKLIEVKKDHIKTLKEDIKTLKKLIKDEE